MASDLHPDMLVEGKKYMITMVDNRRFNARFIGLTSVQHKLQLLLSMSGQKAFMPWQAVKAVVEYQ